VYTAWASVATFVLRLVSENYQGRLDSYFKDVRDGGKLRVKRDAFAGDLETMSRLLATGRHCEASDVYMVCSKTSQHAPSLEWVISSSVYIPADKGEKTRLRAETCMVAA
jgi:hypothetical protein